MNKWGTVAIGALCLLGSMGVAHATIVYDSNLTTADPVVDSGFYNGSSNPNGGFTLTQENGIEIGQRAKGRQQPTVINTPTNVYTVPAGAQTSPPAATRAWWNYDFSINLRPNGVGTLTLADIFPLSTYTIQDLTAGSSHTVGLPYWLDSATWGSTGEENLLTYITAWGLQNSQNATFGDFPLNLEPGYTFDMNAEHYYRFTIDVRTASGLLASNTIDIAVGSAELPSEVPEPASLALVAAGLLGFRGIAAVSKRRKAKKARAAAGMVS